MRRHDLTKKYLPTYIPTHLPTYLFTYLCTSIRTTSRSNSCDVFLNFSHALSKHRCVGLSARWVWRTKSGPRGALKLLVQHKNQVFFKLKQFYKIFLFNVFCGQSNCRLWINPDAGDGTEIRFHEILNIQQVSLRPPLICMPITFLPSSRADLKKSPQTKKPPMKLPMHLLSKDWGGRG